jgi:CDP-4-dehydro-6-deoxyglucose reductase, E1
VEEYCEVAHRTPPFVPGRSSVRVSGRVYDSSDVKSLVDSALEFWLTTGHFNEEFQHKLGQRIGARHVYTVNSGSSANLVAFLALTSHMMRDRRVLPGSEVITAAAGFPTTINPAIIAGMTPVFVDVDIPTYNVDPDEVEAAITPKTRAIMLAHTLGNPFDAVRLAEIAKRYGLWLIEDCCDALGATVGGQHVGSFGSIGTLSFYPAHHITMGEGGAAFTNNALLGRVIDSLREWGRDCYCDPGAANTCGMRFSQKMGELPYGYDHKYTYSHLGYNLKITDMQAAVGLSQLRHLEDFIATRRHNFALLDTALRELEEFFILPVATPNTEPSWFGYTLTVRDDAPFKRADIIQYLDERKIDTRLLFGGNLTRQPYMRHREYRVHGKLTNSDRIMNQTFWIGLYPGLGEEAIAYAVESIHDYCRNGARA